MTQTPNDERAKELLNKYDLPSKEKYGKRDILFIVEQEKKEAIAKTKKEMRVCQEKDFRGITCIQVCKRRNDEVRVETAKEIFKELNIWCLQGLTDFHMNRATYEKIKARFLKC